jgi:hypothetical protein
MSSEIIPNGIDLNKLKNSNDLDEVLSTLVSLLNDACCTLDADTMIGGDEIRDTANKILKEYEV